MKAYLYCSKTKPYLYDCEETINTPRYHVFNHESTYHDKLNGSVCFECEINKVDEIRHDYSPLGDDLFFTKSVSIPVDFEKRTCLNTEQLNSYQPRYALYLENVKKIKPIPIPSDVVNRPKKAPQNMCRITLSSGETGVLISIQPQHLCNVANGLKDIEVRKSILNGLKELIKNV